MITIKHGVHVIC